MLHIISGAETNFKVGGEGAHVWYKVPKNILSCPSTFLALQVKLFVLVSAFEMASTVWSVSSLLFFYSQCLPPCPAVCKSGGGARAPVPYGVGDTAHTAVDNCWYLRLNVKYGHESLSVDVAYGVQLRSVHCLLVGAVLEVLIFRDVFHHLLVRHEKVAATMLLIFAWRTRRICKQTQVSIMNFLSGPSI